MEAGWEHAFVLKGALPARFWGWTGKSGCRHRRRFAHGPAAGAGIKGKCGSGCLLSHVISFTIYGAPEAKLRARTVQRGNGRVWAYTPAKTRRWEEAVRRQALAHRPDAPLDGPLRVKMVFYMPKPKSRRKGDRWADRRPDWDNLGKAVADALEGLFWVNDSRLVDVRVLKLYGDPPRCEITIENAPGDSRF